MPLFSIIVPTYNRRALLAQALSSVFGQNEPDHEVLVVDDGSTDGTQEELARMEDRLTVIRQGNLGPAAARNAGIRCARGEYLAFLDSDDVWFPWTERVYREVIELHGRPAFLAGRPLVFRDPEELRQVRRQEAVATAFPDYLASGNEWRWFGTSSFVVKADAMRRTGGFADIRVGEDADLALKLGTEPGFVQVLAPFTFGYREHPGLKGQLDSAVEGAMGSISRELGGSYPGGRERARERRRILTRALRPLTLECLRSGRPRPAWQLYGRMFSWNLRQGRLRYVVGFPVHAVFHQIASSLTRRR